MFLLLKQITESLNFTALCPTIKINGASGYFFFMAISPYFVQIRENVDEEKAAYLEAFHAVINVNILLDLPDYNVVSI